MGISIIGGASAGGGGAAPLPGATNSVVQGQFLIAASVSTSLAPGSYVGTVLQSTSGISKLDVKKNTSGAVGVLEAGVVTLDTVVETEAGFTLFSQFNSQRALPSVTVSSHVLNDPTWADYQAGSTQIEKHFIAPNGLKFVFANLNAQNTGGSYKAARVAYELSADGKSWSVDLNDNSGSQSSSNWRSFSNPCYHSNGEVWLAMHGEYNVGDQSAIYYELSSNGWNGPTDFSTGTEFFSDGHDINVFYKYDNAIFANDNAVFYKATSIPTSSWTDVSDFLPGDIIGYVYSSSKTSTGEYVFLGQNGYAVVASDLSGYTFTTWSTVSGGNFTNINDAYFNGTYWIACSSANESLVYTTNPSNTTWSIRQNWLSGLEIRSIDYDTVNNRWVLGSDQGIMLVFNSSDPNSSYTQYNIGSGTQTYIRVNNAHGMYYARYNSDYTVVRRSSNGGSSWVNDSIPVSTKKADFADDGNNTGLIVGYSATDSSIPIILRTTNGTSWTSVTPPFTGTQAHMVVFDETLNLFVMTKANDFHIYTSPDGLTWTDRGLSESNSTYNGRFYRRSLFSDNGEVLVGSYNSGSPILRVADITTSPVATNPASGLVRSAPKPMQAVEEGGKQYLLMTTGQLYEQTSNTPTFVETAIMPGSVSDSYQYVPLMKHEGRWHFYQNNGGIWWSTDLVNWTATGPSNATSIAYLNGKVYYSGSKSLAVSDDDGATWQSVTYTDERSEQTLKALFAQNGNLVSAYTAGSPTFAYGQIMDGSAKLGVVYYESELEDI